MNIQIFEGATIRVDADNLVCITDIYKIAVERGMAEGKQNPYEWSRPQRSVRSGSTGKIDDVVSGGRQFIDFVAKNLNTAATHIYKTTRGKGGGDVIYALLNEDQAYFLLTLSRFFQKSEGFRLKREPLNPPSAGFFMSHFCKSMSQI